MKIEDKSKNNISGFYKTSNFPLTIVLSLSFPIEYIEKEPNSQRAFFFFKTSPKLEEMINSYWSNSIKIEPQEFYNQMKTIKSRLREGFNKNEE